MSRKIVPIQSTGIGVPPIALERDTFLSKMIRELAGTLQDIVGVEEASSLMSIVGQRIGEEINEDYKDALQVTSLTAVQVRDALLDLKRRIQGKFYLIEEDEDKIIFGNRACPFAEKVIDRPAMCMMTSNIFGVVTAENLGYSKVVLEQTIAEGSSSCCVVIYLKPTSESKMLSGREYFKS